MQDRRPTIEDVARVAGVSRATASRVINNGRGTSDEAQTRVHQAVDRLGYRPNPAARMLALGRTDVIDLVVLGYEADLAQLGANPYFSRVVAGALSALAGTDTHLRVRIVAENAVHRSIDEIARATTQGAILVNVPPPLATRFHDRCERVVSLGATADRVPAVEARNAHGAQVAVTYLHDLGRRRIAAVHGPAGNTCAASRRAGHLHAIHAAGLPDITGDGQFRREAGYRATARLIATRPDIDAVFAASDLMAAGAIQALTAAGRRIPDDVSVVGFDDSVIATAVNPPMTTVRLPVEQMAAAATRTLLDGGAAAHWRLVFPVDLVVRASTAGVTGPHVSRSTDA
ncbi:LacI family DNA-binding transcriptional regulator [Polymorphospora rubra]|uniref:LacI family transcriptional regulator n=1 Tax=Polymorphospora rubra TaxID=338584 RepID=A0A810N1T0_9ACTN|nr:LacI family DNA-binding transcriptional regulator [Polymorphospora rubra]BCJ66840.1 LacI family transcriptional regulator [Polymorphospora rubra]